MISSRLRFIDSRIFHQTSQQNIVQNWNMKTTLFWWIRQIKLWVKLHEWIQCIYVLFTFYLLFFWWFRLVTNINKYEREWVVTCVQFCLFCRWDYSLLEKLTLVALYGWYWSLFSLPNALLVHVLYFWKRNQTVHLTISFCPSRL